MNAFDEFNSQPLRVKSVKRLQNISEAIARSNKYRPNDRKSSLNLKDEKQVIYFRFLLTFSNPLPARVNIWKIELFDKIDWMYLGFIIINSKTLKYEYHLSKNIN